MTGDELASGLQLQRVGQSDFPNVVRLFELDCCAIPLTAAGAVAWLELGTQGGEVEVPLTEGPSGAAHRSDGVLPTSRVNWRSSPTLQLSHLVFARWTAPA